MAKRTDKDWITPVGDTPPKNEAPQPKRGGSRVDTLPEDFIERLQGGPLQIGDIIAGRYKLEKVLGDGAMGQVFVAENVAIGRKCAVKVLKAELLADPSFRQRFQHESEAIAAIEHRNVARFLDLVVGDPTFLVMEYVRGPTLEEVLEKEKRLAIQRALSICLRLCWALEAAHQAGVIHRDIKPSNVILTPDLEAGEEPKLIDFGLAKLANTAVKAGLTRTGQIVGTPEYMAPEQIANKPVDARSDVYALGCLLYEMLTGKPPFEGQDDVQVLYQQLHDQPKPLEQHVADAPRELRDLLKRSLAKKPEDRYQSMRELAMAIDCVPDPMAPLASPSEETTGHTGRHRRTGRVRMSPARVGRIAALVGAGALAIGIVAGRWSMSGSGGGHSALLVLSSPAGAQVELDGKPLAEPTPTAVRGLKAGPHAVKLKKGQGKTAMAVIERQVQLADGERAVVNVVLPPASHPVEVHSAPEGAAVYLDGKLAVGETPTVIDVTDEEFHEVRVEKNGFETANKALTPDDHDAVLRISLLPERQPRGTLMVDSNGVASVLIDGVDTGYTTPTLGIHVPVGTHSVEVRDNAQGRATAKVRVEQGQTVRLLLTPVKP